MLFSAGATKRHFSPPKKPFGNVCDSAALIKPLGLFFSTFFLLLPFTKMSALLFFFPSPFFFSTRFIYGDEYHFRPDGVEGALVVIRSSSAATAQSVEFFSLEATDNPALLKIDDKSPNYTARKTFAVTTVLSTRNSSRAPKVQCFSSMRICVFAGMSRHAGVF